MEPPCLNLQEFSTLAAQGIPGGTFKLSASRGSAVINRSWTREAEAVEDHYPRARGISTLAWEQRNHLALPLMCCVIEANPKTSLFFSFLIGQKGDLFPGLFYTQDL